MNFNDVDKNVQAVQGPRYVLCSIWGMYKGRYYLPLGRWSKKGKIVSLNVPLRPAKQKYKKVSLFKKVFYTFYDQHILGAIL